MPLLPMQAAELHIPGLYVGVHLLVMEVQVDAQDPEEGVHEVPLFRTLQPAPVRSGDDVVQAWTETEPAKQSFVRKALPNKTRPWESSHAKSAVCCLDLRHH